MKVEKNVPSGPRYGQKRTKCFNINILCSFNHFNGDEIYSSNVSVVQ